MRLLPPKAYVEYLNHLLANPPRDPSLQKRYKRQLIAVMDGFHYTLRPDEGKRVLQNMQVFAFTASF